MDAGEPGLTKLNTWENRDNTKHRENKLHKHKNKTRRKNIESLEAERTSKNQPKSFPKANIEIEEQEYIQENKLEVVLKPAKVQKTTNLAPISKTNNEISRWRDLILWPPSATPHFKNA